MSAPDLLQTWRRARVGLISLCLSGLAGCGDRGIVGTWAGKIPTPGEKSALVSLNFKPDATMSQSTEIMGHTVSGLYMYTVKGDRISETLTGGAFDGKPIRVARSLKPAVVYTYKLDGDNLFLKSNIPGGNLSLKRVE